MERICSSLGSARPRKRAYEIPGWGPVLAAGASRRASAHCPRPQAEFARESGRGQCRARELVKTAKGMCNKEIVPFHSFGAVRGSAVPSMFSAPAVLPLTTGRSTSPRPETSGSAVSAWSCVLPQRYSVVPCIRTTIARTARGSGNDTSGPGPLRGMVALRKVQNATASRFQAVCSRFCVQ